MKFLLSGVCLLLAQVPAFAAWQDSLTPDTVGPTPEVRPFQATFRFGWSEIEAASASARVSYDGDDILLEGKGGTNGTARYLWQMDVTHEARTKRSGFQIVDTKQTETYRTRTIDTHIVARPDAIWRLRETGAPTPGTWKKVNISPLRDLFGGMLFVRSQRLTPGDEVRTIIYPGDSPFLVTWKATGIEKITTPAGTWDAIKLEVDLRKINLKQGSILEKHGKFRSGTCWISNDADRIPLRAEVDIFIGYVFGEIVSLTFDPPNP